MTVQTKKQRRRKVTKAHPPTVTVGTISVVGFVSMEQLIAEAAERIGRKLGGKA